MSEFVTRDQLAERLQITTRTLSRLVREGKLPPPIRLTQKVVRYDTAKVQKFLETQTEAGE